MSNYIKNPNLFNTGFLPDNTRLRIKQGLSPQTLSNSCAYAPPSITAYPAHNMPKGAKCNQAALKPAKQVQWNYGTPEIPDNCPCVQYLFQL